MTNMQQELQRFLEEVNDFERIQFKMEVEGKERNFVNNNIRIFTFRIKCSETTNSYLTRIERKYVYGYNNTKGFVYLIPHRMAGINTFYDRLDNSKI